MALRSACRRVRIVGIKRGILFFTEVIGRVYHVKPIVGLPCFFQCYIDFVFLLLARESSSKLSFTEVALPRDSSSKLGSPLGLRNVGSPLARASVHLTDKIFLALCILAFTHVNFVFLLLAQQCSSELGIVFARASVRRRFIKFHFTHYRLRLGRSSSARLPLGFAAFTKRSD